MFGEYERKFQPILLANDGPRGVPMDASARAPTTIP